MTDASPTINFAEIDFPSDQITVKTLRAAFPSSFDQPGPPHEWSVMRSYGRASAGNALDHIIDAERLLAGIAFKKALGQSLADDEAPYPRWEIIEALVTDYGHLGLAVGKQQVEVLVRRIEAQAKSQARRYSTRSR